MKNLRKLFWRERMSIRGKENDKLNDCISSFKVVFVQVFWLFFWC